MRLERPRESRAGPFLGPEVRRASAPTTRSPPAHQRWASGRGSWTTRTAWTSASARRTATEASASAVAGMSRRRATTAPATANTVIPPSTAPWPPLPRWRQLTAVKTTTATPTSPVPRASNRFWRSSDEGRSVRSGRAPPADGGGCQAVVGADHPTDDTGTHPCGVATHRSGLGTQPCGVQTQSSGGGGADAGSGGAGAVGAAAPGAGIEPAAMAGPPDDRCPAAASAVAIHRDRALAATTPTGPLDPDDQVRRSAGIRPGSGSGSPRRRPACRRPRARR